MADENQVSALELSDEEFMKLPMPTEAVAADATDAGDPDRSQEQEAAAAASANENTAEAGEGERGAAPEAEAGEATAGTQDDPAGEGTPPAGTTSTQDQGSNGDEGAAQGQGTQTAPAAQAPDASGTPAKTGDAAGTQAAAAAATPVDYKAAYEKIFTPFKANGREIAVQSVEDAVALMQMGANYNKKMAGMKQHLKVLKMLEKNQLLDESKLSYLIDLDKKNPDAINKLVKESGLDPLDLGADKTGEYQPTAYKVDDREIELDTVLDEIQETPTFNRVIDVVSNKWDGKSKQVVADHPQLLKIINDHMQRGVYDQIVAEVDRERMFGRLNGLSDLDAYRQVGEAIQARNGFVPAGHPGQQKTPTPTAATPNPRKEDDGKLREQRRAASPNHPAVKSTTAPAYDPLALSDDEFMKLGSPKFV
jgi:hypothetical protein